MAGLPESARSLIESAALAHLVTLNRDGSPQLTCVWVGLEGDEIVCGHLPRHQKVRNMERDPRVALSIEGERTNEIGLKEYLVVYGRARVTEGGAPELLQRLAETISDPAWTSRRCPTRRPATSRGSRSIGWGAWGRGRADLALHLTQPLVQPLAQLVRVVVGLGPAPPGHHHAGGRHPRQPGRPDQLPGHAHGP